MADLLSGGFLHVSSGDPFLQSCRGTSDNEMADRQSGCSLHDFASDVFLAFI